MRLRPFLTLLCSFPIAALAQGAAPSLVNVTDARFAAGCPNAADPRGRADSTCAVRAALRSAESSGLAGAGYPVLYFPHGIYKVAGEGYSSALTITKDISLQGDGASSTVLENTSPHAAAITYLKAQGCSGKPGSCPLTIEGITFAGQSDATQGGLLEIDSTDTGSMRNVVLADTGGIALNLQGSSERWYFSDMEISNARWPVVLEGDTNETYFNRVNVLNGGEANGYCYSVNCPGGKRIETGVWRPDPHSAVFLDGDNVHWMNSSIKSTEAIGGIRLATTTSSLTHTYIEGFPWGGQPRTNHAVAAPGKSELGHLTAAVSASALELPVDDAAWQPLYVNDPAQARINGQHSYVNAYGIFPQDYQVSSKEPSRAVPGITRGTFELVQVAAFSADGQAHLFSRGKQPVAWPAGSIVEQAPANGYGSIRLEENHFNSLADNFGRFRSGCSDTAQQQHWTSSPSELCAEIIAGLVPDGYMVPFPTQDYVHNSFALDVVNDSIYTGGTEEGGQGWIKIPGNAAVNIDAQNAPLRSFVDADTALHTYSNGVTRVRIVTYPATVPGAKAASALAYVTDPSAGVRFSPQEGFYVADVMRDGTLAHQYLGSECWYNTLAGSAAPDHRTCAGAGIAGEATYSGGRWIPAAATAAGPSRAEAGGNPVRFTMRDWQVNSLQPQGQAGDCASREAETNGVRFSAAAGPTLVANLQPNPGAQVIAAAAVERDGAHVTVRLCNTGSTPVRWETPPDITLTELP